MAELMIPEIIYTSKTDKQTVMCPLCAMGDVEIDIAIKAMGLESKLARYEGALKEIEAMRETARVATIGLRAPKIASEALGEGSE